MPSRKPELRLRALLMGSPWKTHRQLCNWWSTVGVRLSRAGQRPCTAWSSGPPHLRSRGSELTDLNWALTSERVGIDGADGALG